jgi:hypothetical protein
MREPIYEIIEDCYGSKRWYLDAKRHKVDGPAVVYKDGSGFYYLENIYYTKSEHEKEVEMLCICFNY